MKSNHEDHEEHKEKNLKNALWFLRELRALRGGVFFPQKAPKLQLAPINITKYHGTTRRKKMMIKEAINKIVRGNDLTESEMEITMLDVSWRGRPLLPRWVPFYPPCG